LKSYDQIKAALEAELREAKKLHEREILNRLVTRRAVRNAFKRLQRFALHGMIPEDFA